MAADSTPGGNAGPAHVKHRRPDAGQPIGRWLRLGALALGLGLVPLSESLAQSREVLIGTMTTGAAPITDRGGDRGRMATDLLAEGIGALERGDIMVGRRHLEVLVERYPETLAATSARHELGVLYSDRRRGEVEAGASRMQPRWVSTEPAQQDAARATRETWSGTAPTTGTRPWQTPGDRGMEPERARTAGGQAPAASARPQQDERRRQALAAEFQTTAGDRVFFSETSAELGARARTVLAAQARWLQAHADLAVTIEAHADDEGNRELDVRLAERRGQAVQERLIEEGVAPGRIVVQAFGRDKPVATCSSTECAAQNRRVVTRLGGASEGGENLRRAIDQPAFATAPRQDRRGRND